MNGGRWSIVVAIIRAVKQSKVGRLSAGADFSA